MKNRDSCIFRFLVVIFFLLICIFLAGSAWFISGLPQWAEEKYGPPAIRLGDFQKYTFAARLLYHENELLDPVNRTGEQQEFQVELGESVTAIAGRLEQDGFIKDAEAFRLYLVYAGLDRGVQAGSYLISPALSAVEIAKAMQEAMPQKAVLIIFPGWRIEEIAAALPASGLNISGEMFIEAALNVETTDFAGVDLETANTIIEAGSYEGFLIPDRYEFDRETESQVIFRQILENFNSQVTSDLVMAFSQQDLGVYEAVTLASIVQREAVIPEEQPLIASVFINRLKVGMQLESDPTVQYAIGYDQTTQLWWKNPLFLNKL